MAVKYFLACVLVLLLASPLLAMSAHEQKRVEALFSALAAQPGLVFIRNGNEYQLEAALTHLQRKFNYAADKLDSAEQFIDQAASRSSISGQAYQIRLPNGSTVRAGTYLHELLKGLEGQ